MLPHSLLGQPCNLNKYLSLLTDEDGSTGRLCIDAASLDAAYMKMPEKWAGLAQGPEAGRLAGRIVGARGNQEPGAPAPLSP